MDSTFPQDLLDLKLRVDHWRTTRRFIREALPTELRDAITESLSRLSCGEKVVGKTRWISRGDAENAEEWFGESWIRSKSAEDLSESDITKLLILSASPREPTQRCPSP